MNRIIVACLLILVTPAALAMEGKEKERIPDEAQEEVLIQMNIGGDIYIYPESTLRQSKSIFFNNLLDDKFGKKPDVNGQIFISYSKEAFKEVDHFLTANTLLANCHINVIKEAANYFGLENMLNLVAELETPPKHEPKFQRLKIEASDGSPIVCNLCKKEFHHIYHPDLTKHLEDEHDAHVDPIKPLTCSCFYPASIEFRIRKQ